MIDKIKKEYITSYDIIEGNNKTLKELARKYGYSYGYIRQISSKENWKKIKEEYINMLKSFLNEGIQNELYYKFSKAI